MTREFCEHLEDYGVQFVRAEAAYRALVAQFERVAAGGADIKALELLQRLLADWEDEVRELRRRFASAVRGGRIDLPARHGGTDPAPAACCALCRGELPRLEFPDFTVPADGEPGFRGQALRVPAGV